MVSGAERKRFLPRGVRAELVEVFGDAVHIYARSEGAVAACPDCGQLSRHCHSRYQRRLADLPAHGREVRIVLSVRRFRCAVPHCGRKIFAERFPPEVTRPHARRTTRMQGVVGHLGLALGGRPAQALAGRLLLPVSKDTFLRSARAIPRLTGEAPRVIGSTTGRGGVGSATAR